MPARLFVDGIYTEAVMFAGFVRLSVDLLFERLLVQVQTIGPWMEMNEAKVLVSPPSWREGAVEARGEGAGGEINDLHRHIGHDYAGQGSPNAKVGGGFHGVGLAELGVKLKPEVSVSPFFGLEECGFLHLARVPGVLAVHRPT